jgi:thiol:disulfide interchange protein DsbD
VFYDYVEAELPFSRASPDPGSVSLTVGYQGCQDNGICYPPLVQQVSFLLPASASFTDDGGNLLARNSGGMVSEQDRLAQLIMGGSWTLMLATFYGLGLLLAFTPCVLPMVPILSGIIAGQGDNVTTGRGFALSLAYVMGMALTYTAAGALAAVAGSQIQVLFQTPWVITVFAGLFVLLALAMFGLYELQMPSFIQTRLANMANRQKAGTFVGTAFMGALSALIVTTCVAPPLVATLAVIGQTGDVLRGALALFVLSLGMGSPLLVVGASAGKLLPKAGAWMNAVKAAFGVMMLGLAIWMMERVLPGSITLFMWAALVFLTGVFMGALEPLADGAPAGRRLGKGVGLLACLYGALMLVGATLGGDNPLKPLPRGLLVADGSSVTPEAELAFQPIATVAALEQHLADARNAGRPVMVDFTAQWCVSCKEMEEYTFTDPDVHAALDPYLLLRADVTDNNEDHQALLEYFGIFGPPTIAFFSPDGEELRGYRLVGYVPAEEFADHVSRAANL